MLRFIPEKKYVNILTEQGGIALGYIDDKNLFFPNNNMLFKLEWMQEITMFMFLTSISDVRSYKPC